MTPEPASSGMKSGICRFGLWRAAVEWNESEKTIHRISFLKTGDASPVPIPVMQFLSGKRKDLLPYKSAAMTEGSPYYKIYREVSKIPYGETRTYSQIAEACGVNPRTVGTAMKRNPTPLIIPCHRVTAKNGLGGFTPDIEIKMMLLKNEAKVLKKEAEIQKKNNETAKEDEKDQEIR